MMDKLNYNDVELTRKIVEIVRNEVGVSGYISAIHGLKLKNDSDDFSRGYDEAIDDVIALLKGER